MRNVAILGLATALMLSAACVAEGTLGDSSGPGPDAGARDIDDEPDRPERPDPSPDELLPDAAPPPLPCIEGDAQLFDDTTNHCYVLLDAPRNWPSAQQSCTDLGMHLATIADDTENTLVHQLTGNGREAWLGGNDILAENNWLWPTDEPMTYQNWRAGEPNNSGGEDCMVFQGNQNGKWDDRPCGKGYDVICERDYP